MIFEAALETDEIVTDTRSHAFPVSIAEKYSITIALWLQHIAFWTENNLSLNKNIHDGLCWSYTTLEALRDKFPYMSKSQIETMINNSINHGLLIKGNYNQNKYDRTIWYALTPKAYIYFGHLLNEKYLQRLYLSISEKSEIDFGDFRNGFPKIRTPIPDTKPDTKPYINNISTSAEVPDIGYNKFDEQFEKSDYPHNQTKSEKNDAQVIEREIESTKSDYFDNQANIKSAGKLIIPFELKNIQEENIFSIPEQTLLDWIANRKKKRVPVTQTAWNKINKELAKLKEKGIDPIDAFETMVASGWQSIKLEYFESQKKTTAFQWDVESVMKA
jgi:hypothetical protein